MMRESSQDIWSAERQAIVHAYQRLADAGLLQLNSGNLSTRIGDKILITPTGADRSIAEQDLVIVNHSGEVETGGMPSSEWAMHAAIYATRADASAVVHTHGDACTAMSCLRRPLPAFHYMVASFGGDDVPCTGFAPFGSMDLATMAAVALRERSACLLANHGMICFGPEIGAAANAALKLEMLCRQFILASHAGAPVLLSPSEMDETRRRYVHYGHSRIPEVHDRE